MTDHATEALAAINAHFLVNGVPELPTGHDIHARLGWWVRKHTRKGEAPNTETPTAPNDDVLGYADQLTQWERLRAGHTLFMLAGLPRCFLAYVRDGVTGQALMRVITLRDLPPPENETVRWDDLAWDGRYRLKPIEGNKKSHRRFADEAANSLRIVHDKDLGHIGGEAGRSRYSLDCSPQW